MFAFRDELRKEAALAGALGSVARFGQRQLHGMTGWVPKAGIGALKLDPVAQASGLTSLPAVWRAARNEGLSSVIRRGAATSMAGSGLGGKALMIGAPAVQLGSTAMSEQTPEGQGPSKEERMGRDIGSIVGNVAASPLPFVANTAVGEAAGQAGKYIGRGVHKVRTMLTGKTGLHPNGPHAAQSTDLTRESGQAVPSETLMTSRASGAGASGSSGGFE